MKGMIKKLSAAIVAAALLLSLHPLVALAAISGDFVYSVSNGKAIITEYTGDGGTVVIPSTLGGYPVAGIGDWAFSQCDGLSSVTVPACVTSIGDSAFADCGGLTSVILPASVVSIGDSAFSECVSLNGIAIPAGVVSIGASAFSGCGNMVSVTIPDGVSSIGEMAFEGCRSLTSIRIPRGLISIKDGTFWGCMALQSVTVPDNITRIGDMAFALCSSLTSIIIPDSVTTIGEVAFTGCVKLASIQVDAANTTYASQDGVLFDKAKKVLLQYPIGHARTSYTTPPSVIRIEYTAFMGSGNLKNVTVTGGVASIEDGAFAQCSRLENVAIANGVISIGSYAFADCTRLAGITLPASVAGIGESAFTGCNRLATIYVASSSASYASQDGVLFNKAKTRLIQYPMGNGRSSYTVPAGVARISDSAFDSAIYLTSVTIPGSVTTIDDWAFFSCERLGNAYFLGNAPAMGDEVFDECRFDFSIGYVQGKKGFSNPWYGYPATAYAVPATPGSFGAVSASYNSVKLTWAAVSGANGYEVYRATSSVGAYTKIATIASGTATAYTNSGLTQGSTYYYKVRAYRKMGGNTLYGGYSAVKSAKPTLAAPAVKAAAASYSSVKLTWGAVAGAGGYEVYRATSAGGVYAKVITTAALSHTNSGLATGTTYFYKVRAYRTVNGVKIYGIYSAVQSAKPALATPAGVKAARASATSVKVSWGAVAGAGGYEVYRAATPGGAYTKVITTASLSHTNTGLATGKIYYYKVRAYRTVGGVKVYSGYTAVVSAKP